MKASIPERDSNTSEYMGCLRVVFAVTDLIFQQKV
jgi:hypothetical protein